MTGTDHLPPERRLPPRRRDQILRSVLNGEEPNMSEQPRSRRAWWIAPLMVAAAVALIAVGVIALTGSDSPAGDGSAQPAGQPAGNTEPMDLGPLPDDVAQDQAERCVAEGQGADADEYAVPYARRMNGPSGPASVVVAASEAGGWLNYSVCEESSQYVVTHQARVPRAAPDAERPIIPVLGQSRLYRTWIDHWRLTGVYRVDESIDRVEVRVGTPDGPEPWHASKAHGGYAYWAVWSERGPYGPDDEVWLEWRAYDTNGDLVDPELMPDQPRQLQMTPPNRQPNEPEQGADFDEVHDLLFEVAKDHFEPQGEHLDAAGPRSGTHSGPEYYAVRAHLTWTNPGETGGAVTVSLGQPGTYTDDKYGELWAYAGCDHVDGCHRQDLGNDGWAWVGESDGRVSVAYTQPDGEHAFVFVDPASTKFGAPVSSIDITIEQALDFVTDERLDMPVD